MAVNDNVGNNHFVCQTQVRLSAALSQTLFCNEFSSTYVVLSMISRSLYGEYSPHSSIWKPYLIIYQPGTLSEGPAN